MKDALYLILFWAIFFFFFYNFDILRIMASILYLKDLYILTI